MQVGSFEVVYFCDSSSNSPPSDGFAVAATGSDLLTPIAPAPTIQMDTQSDYRFSGTDNVRELKTAQLVDTSGHLLTITASHYRASGTCHLGITATASG
jgi:hypothetical protein